MATNLGCWNGSTWNSLGFGTRYQTWPGYVFSVAAVGNNVYVSGLFTSVAGVAATNLAMWNGMNWSAVPGSPHAGEVIAGWSERLYSGGIDGVAEWDGTEWRSLWSPYLHDHSIVRTLGFDSQNLYAAGAFTNVGTVVATNIAQWDGTDWSDMGRPFCDDVDIRSIAATTNFIYVGGSFNSAAGMPVSGIVRYDGTNWSSLGSGLRDFNQRTLVQAMITSGNRVYAAGLFKTAGGKPSYRFAEWHELPAPLMTQRILPPTRYSFR